MPGAGACQGAVMDDAPAASLPATVRLRPGVPVLRRDADRLQLGVGPAAVLVTGDRESDLVRALASRPLPSDEDNARLLTRLWEAGLLADSAAWERDRAAGPRLVATAYARDPRGAHERLSRRTRTRVALHAPAPWAPELRGLLADAGLADATDGADVALLVTRGEPDRRRLDGLTHHGTPHLLLRMEPDRVTIGPFVVPGRTACLRCEDAHRTDGDPRWPLLLAQLAGRDAGGEAPEPVLLTWAGAWAARDLATYAEGDRPATWSARVGVDADLTLRRDDLLRHPHCGCAWGEMLQEAGPAA